MQYILLNPYHGKAQRIEVPYYETNEEQVWKNLTKGPHPNGMGNDNEISTYRVHRQFLRSLQTGAAPFSNGEIARDAVHIALAAEHSLRTGQTVPWDSADIAL
jgi:predicted dehydrogenase